MHEFQRRLQQYLDSVPDLTAGHRERLLRPMKQLDLDCWGEFNDPSMEDALKASMRSIAHELVDFYCLQIEPAFAQCRGDVQKVMLAALAAHKLPAWNRILYRVDGRLSGYSYSWAETVIIEPSARIFATTVDFLVEFHARPAIGSGPITDTFQDRSEPDAVVATLAVQCGEPEVRSDVKLPDRNLACPVLNFSDAAIRENPFQCAAEVFRRLRVSPTASH